MSMDVWRRRYGSKPVSPVDRELLSSLPDLDPDDDKPLAPILCVTGDSRGAGAFTEHWLPRIAERGRAGYAVSVRGQGGTPKADGGRDGRVHDIVQAAVSLPGRAVLIGHDKAAPLVARALTRYPAEAAVFLAPKGLASKPSDPTGSPRVLIAGSPDDRAAPEKVLDKAATAYGGAPLLFPGVGHDFMNDPGWKAPLDALLDWLDDRGE
ncbi:MAG TPA: hypothetical protein VE172_02135 [Stackebrandtia sp.]|jgi:dienelactone hydrolase|uniref:alpha/beta hydrolase n=1 Tax=Stackebrandtia sp. TaxID=2023065 RepID=UPI002D375A5B|nr:hypothetical protein [Stackebrandtia sp.]HZE37585.1 hypothetical protein [Stackebrandtia sp.]